MLFDSTYCFVQGAGRIWFRILLPSESTAERTAQVCCNVLLVQRTVHGFKVLLHVSKMIQDFKSTLDMFDCF